MTGLACLAIVATVLWWTIKATRRQVVDDSQPSPVDRLAAWERRMGQHRAERRMAEYRARIAFDERATVQPRIVPRLPK